jgi:acetyl esterase
VLDTNADGVPVRIYKNTSEENQRVMMFYHGGGFVLYGLYSHDNVCRRLSAMNNCIVVSVDYRLAPEHTFPAAHDDAYTALLWTRNNISFYGGNPEDIVVAGDSAGGNLSACIAHRCRKSNIPLKAQVLIYPWVDGRLSNPSIERNGKGYLLEKETMFWFQQQYTPKPEDHCVPEVSPCFEKEFKGLAPAFILTAQYDPLIDDGLLYYNQLREAGVMVKYAEYEEMFHGFFHLPHLHSNAMKAFHDIEDFLATI